LVEHHHQITYPYQKNVDWTIPGHCLKLKFTDANFTSLPVIESEKSATYYNYYLGSDRGKWQGKVPAYHKLNFREIYPKVDLIIYNSGSNFKYDILIKPGADLSKVKIEYQGAENLKIEEDNLSIKTSVNEIIEQKPYAYQVIEGIIIDIPCSFNLQGNMLSFNISSYDERYELTIDPFIVFSRYSSSSANNFGYTATYDGDGNAYGAGSVFNIGYITTPGAFDNSFDGIVGQNTDIGITKYTSDGLNRIYATYLGGLQTELPHSIVVNSKDELFVFGTTGSFDFPTSSNCYDSTFAGGTLSDLSNGLGVIYPNGSDLIVSRFSEDGSNLLASTYMGGSLNDGLNLSPGLKFNYADEVRGEIFIDANDNCIVSSCSYSADFPVVNAFQTSNNGSLDGVVFKMNENLNNLIWSSYLGGALDDASYSIGLDNNQNLLVAGGTQSIDFPVSNALQGSFNGGIADGFITKIHSSGANILFSTYYGTNNYDQIYFLDLNADEEIHVFGQTKGPSGALVQNAAYNNPNGGQFLSKFNSDLSAIVWSTRFGDGTGKPDISPTAFLVDVCNQVFLSGWGSSNLAGNSNLSGTSGLDVTSDALDPITDNSDFYFMVMRDDASALIYASFFGGQSSAEHVDGGTSRFDKKGVIYQAVCAGCGGNQDFPTIPMDSIGFWNNNNSCNLGLVKYAFTPPSIIADFDLPLVDCLPQNLNFNNLSQTAFNDTSASLFTWRVNDSLITSYNLNYDFTEAGNYTITLIAIDSNSCNFIDSIAKQLTTIGNSAQNLDTLSTCLGAQIQIGIRPILGNNIQYSWTPAAGLSASDVSNPFATLSQDQTYTLIVSNGNCIDTFIQTVLFEELAIDLSYRDSICLNDTFSIQATAINNVFYQWEPSSQLQTVQGVPNAVFIATNPMIVICTATSPNNCLAQASATITVLDQLPDISVSATPDTIILGETSQLEAFSSVTNVFNWAADTTLNALNISDPIASPLETNDYFVNINDGFCPNKAAITVYVKLPECIDGKVFVPNAFSPNGDGNNDIFQVRSSAQIDEFYFTVYDRWGQQVFEGQHQAIGWDGKFENAVLSPAAFAWYCSGFCENGEAFFLKGNVTLLK
jgi:gliding motility-associated-like protein